MSRPDFLGAEHADAFDDREVARAYRLRPSYPPQIFDELLRLLRGQPGWVLDLGCGTGLLARTLMRSVGRIDAVDSSAAMIEEARRLPGGNARGLRWIVAPAETAPLAGLYGLAVAGDSLQWMDWDVVLPRVARALAPGAFLAIVGISVISPWEDEVRDVVKRFSRNPGYDPDFQLVAELERRDLLKQAGAVEVPPTTRRQKADDYIESFHARSSLTRRRLGKDAFAFDEAMRLLLRRHGATEVELTIRTGVVWGAPKR